MCGVRGMRPGDAILVPGIDFNTRASPVPVRPIYTSMDMYVCPRGQYFRGFQSDLDSLWPYYIHDVAMAIAAIARLP